LRDSPLNPEGGIKRHTLLYITPTLLAVLLESVGVFSEKQIALIV
jgi:hypothetical protein